MNWFESKKGTAAGPQPDAELEQVLVDFRQSAHAWSEAEFNRPRAVRVAAHSAWRHALAWALGCVVVAGGVSGGIYEHRRDVVARQLAHDRILHQQQLAAQQKANETDESLLANVDTDVSRSVPAAMEPLAQLMDENGTN
jgi:hypothetical protein